MKASPSARQETFDKILFSGLCLISLYGRWSGILFKEIGEQISGISGTSHRAHQEPRIPGYVMKQRKEIKALGILADIQSGLGDVPLMEKYGLSPEELKRVYERLSDSAFFRAHGLELRKSRPKKESQKTESRSLPRNHALVRLPVFDARSHHLKGLVIDITTEGLKVAGLQAKPGDVRWLVLRSDLFLPGEPLTLNVRCQWTRMDQDDGELQCGFQILGGSP